MFECPVMTSSIAAYNTDNPTLRRFTLPTDSRGVMWCEQFFVVPHVIKLTNLGVFYTWMQNTKHNA